jgi:uncharacterized protein with HEPN domain
MIEAMDVIRTEVAGIDLQAFTRDLRKCWVVERGLEIISEASRRLPEVLKQRHANIPWSKVAGIGNILRHEYEHVAYDLIWRVVHDELPKLETVCRTELASIT